MTNQQESTARSSAGADKTALKRQALDYAKEALAKGGPGAVKARDVAATLGVSVGTVYNLFGDLDTLLFAANAEVYDNLYALVDQAAREAKASGASFEDQLLALAAAYLDFVANVPELWAGVLTFNRRHKAEPPDWYKAREHQLFDVIRRTVLYADEFAQADKGGGDKELPIAAEALWGAVHGIVTVSTGQNKLIASRDDVWSQISLVVRALSSAIQSEMK